MERLREYLRKQYIGAIVIGLLVFQGATGLLSAVTGVIFAKLLPARVSESVLGFPATKQPFPWDMFVSRIIDFSLYLLCGYILLRWLYWIPKNETELLEEDQSREGE